MNDTQPRWDSARSVGAGNDRNERYPSFPTIALPLELEQAIFAGFGRFRLCMEGINLGIWEARETINFSTLVNNKQSNYAWPCHIHPTTKGDGGPIGAQLSLTQPALGIGTGYK